MKYRILKSGDKFFIQRKTFLFWRYIKKVIYFSMYSEHDQGKCCSIYFTSKEKAYKYIEFMRSNK